MPQAQNCEDHPKGPGKTARQVSGGGRILALLAVATLLLAFFLIFAPGLRYIVHFTGQLDAGGLRDYILSTGAWAPVAYFLVVVGQVILSPIPAGPVTLAGALVFGVWWGLALSMIGSVVGSTLIFMAVRRWGEPLLLRFVDARTYARYSARLGEGGWLFFLIMLLPLVPDDAVCALAGLSAMSFRRYAAFMILGRLPGTTLTALLASGAISGSASGWIMSGTILAVLLALGIVYRARLESLILNRPSEQDHEYGLARKHTPSAGRAPFVGGGEDLSGR